MRRLVMICPWETDELLEAEWLLEESSRAVKRAAGVAVWLRWAA